mgnify:CR=1 FL=1
MPSTRRMPRAPAGAADALRDHRRGLAIWRTFAGGQIDIVQADQAGTGCAAERAASAPDVLRYESARADALSQRALRAQQLVDEIERADRTLRRWLTDIGQDRAQRPWQDQLAAVGARALTVLNAVWGFELFG